MLVRASSALAPDLYLLKLGDTCRYLVGSENSFALSDPGLSIHVQNLPARLNEFGFSLQGLSTIFLTHAHPDRIAGLPYLRRLAPQARVVAPATLHTNLSDREFLLKLYQNDAELCALYPGQNEEKLSFDEYAKLFALDRSLSSSETITVSDELSLRTIPSLGHAQPSFAYLVAPSNFLICDEVAGYFRGSMLAAPGADLDLQAALKTLKIFIDLKVSGLCLPQIGALTGDLASRHLEACARNIEDLLSEFKKAVEAGKELSDIKQSIVDSFFSSDSRDPLVKIIFEQSLNGVWEQLSR